jgi:hypothetical protein
VVSPYHLGQLALHGFGVADKSTAQPSFNSHRRNRTLGARLAVFSCEDAMNYQYILVSLKAYDAAQITALVTKIKAMEGVFKIGNLEWEEESPSPPYFFVYVTEGTDLAPLCDEIKKDSNVTEAQEPPARYAA